MRKRLSLTLAILTLWLNVGLAAPIRLFAWQPEGGSTRLLLPVPEGTEPESAAARYLKALRSNAALKPLLASGWLDKITGTFEPLTEAGGKPLFALLDNSFEPRTTELRAFSRGGADAYLIPMGAGLGLSPEEAGEFRELVAARFDALVAVGGADVAPVLYGDPVTFARDTNVTRDRMEIAFIRAYLASGHGVLYGLCRGHQLVAVTLGYKLIQDLKKETGVAGHEAGKHGIAIVASSSLGNFLGGVEKAVVNSFHHEAVRPGPGSLTVTATAGNVIEGMESANRRIITFQFHPEAMDNETGRKIMRGMVEHVKRATCAVRIARGRRR